GDDGMSPFSGWGSGSIRSRAAHDVPREDRRWWDAARRVRREEDHHGEGGTSRPGLSGGNTQRKPLVRGRSKSNSGAPEYGTLRTARDEQWSSRSRTSKRCRGCERNCNRATSWLDDHLVLSSRPHPIVG